MAKVRKKYNKHKNVGKLADALLRDIVICYADNLKGCVMLDRKQSKLIRPTEAMVAAASVPHQWSCFIAALGRTKFDEYFKAEQIFTPSKFYQSDLAPIFEMHHAQLMRKVPEDQLCGVGWIADPNGNDISEKEAGSIFEKLGAWG